MGERLRNIARDRFVVLGMLFAGLAWLVYVFIDTPTTYRAQNWNAAWLGFDIGLFIALGTAFWAIVKRRQLAIPAAIVSATFLFIDTWFDVITSAAGWDFRAALISGFLIQLPTAFFLLRFARHAIHDTYAVIQRQVGVEIEFASLRKMPLNLKARVEE